MSGVRRRMLVGALAAALSPRAVPGTPPLVRGVRASVRVGSAVLRPSVPESFFSFNLNSITLDYFHWDAARAALHPELLRRMKAFPGAVYRYPGGLIGNNFAWEWAMGPLPGRKPQRGEKWAGAAPVRFGPAEYLDFLRQVGGQSWYTLNLVGWSERELAAELPEHHVAQSNGRLAVWRSVNDSTPVHHYHLGNELDRSIYQWPTTKYLARCRASIDAVASADPRARFVAFLRDFDWHYRGRPGVSRATDLAADVLKALPEVQDVSLQLYYDRREETEGKVFDIPWRMKLVDRFIEQVQSLRPGVRVWVTEHAKAKPDSVARPEWRLPSTSGIDGAIASADMCIWLLQRPAVQAAFWHALGGGAWWDLFRAGEAGLPTTPVYDVLQLLREHAAVGPVLERRVDSSAVGGYSGGYDINVAVLGEPATASRVVWIVNRANGPGILQVQDPTLVGRRLRAQMESVAATSRETGLDSQFETTRGRFGPQPLRADSTGALSVEVPARCVAVLRLAPDGG